MPAVRLIAPYRGQPVGSIYLGDDGPELVSKGVADTQLALSGDYSTFTTNASAADAARPVHVVQATSWIINPADDYRILRFTAQAAVMVQIPAYTTAQGALGRIATIRNDTGQSLIILNPDGSTLGSILPGLVQDIYRLNPVTNAISGVTAVLSTLGVSAPYINRGYIDLDSAGISTAFTPPSSTTAAVQALLQQAADEKRILRGRSVTVEPLLIPPGMLGMEGITFTVRRDLVAGTYTLLSLLNPTDQTSWNTNGVRMVGCRIAGNRSNQANGAVINGLDINHDGGAGGGSFKPRHIVEDFRAENLSGFGGRNGSYTRDSIFDMVNIYSVLGYGWQADGVDSLLSRFDIGQAYRDAMKVGGSEQNFVQIFLWAAGMLNTTNPGTDPNWDPTTSAGLRITGASNNNILGVKTQQSAGSGVDISGSGAAIKGHSVIGWLSDGDNGADLGRAALNLYRADKTRVVGKIGKSNSGFTGGPKIPFSSSICADVDVSLLNDTTNITSPAYAAQPATTTGNVTINGQQILRRLNVSALVGGNINVNPYDGVIQRFGPLTGNVTFNVVMGSGNALIDGAYLEIAWFQDATGGRTISWGTNMRAPVTTISTAASTYTRVGVLYDASISKFIVTVIATGA